ncbi:MAG: carboxy-S-adenosyl-L-methionine synthase CmoA [Gammaproteobacteria bacterium]|nr:carboxy-S-adenosyl-L-methionine synthase CmoA [Gammaproteobacteria bacterium]
MSTDQRDTLFNSPEKPSPFRFDEKVAAVFPDMIGRSVPGYSAIIDGIHGFASRFLKSNTVGYDLGCSLGAAALAMSKGASSENAKVVAVDNSEAMIQRCKILMESYGHITPVDVIHGDISKLEIKNASMVVLNFTLQFIEQKERALILKKIFDGMTSGGLLILSEKVLGRDETTNQLLIDLHHEFKRANGYSDLEISQKRTALENVLVPETIDDHRDRLQQIGFQHFDVWHQSFNFCSMLAIK